MSEQETTPVEEPIVDEVQEEQIEEQPETDELVEETPEAVEEQPELEPVAALSEGERFLEAFGDQGGVWFAQGLSFDEARDKHNENLQAELDRLREENSQLRSQVEAASFGEEEEVSGGIPQGQPSERKQIVKEQEKNMGRPEAAFAAHFISKTSN